MTGALWSIPDSRDRLMARSVCGQKQVWGSGCTCRLSIHQTCKLLQGMAEGMLGDPKLEVADVAAATLSGMLKVAPDAAAAATRARFLDAASVASSSRRNARRRGASSAGEQALPSGCLTACQHVCNLLGVAFCETPSGGCSAVQAAGAVSSAWASLAAVGNDCR